jgi:large subunit ribosomal protein L9
MATQVILLEKVDHLGAMGEVVNVKPGYARNYLLPQNKALRATKQNIAYFEAQKSAIEKVNNEKKAVAEKSAKKVDGAKVAIIRQASEGGQLFGSVSSRDIADAIEAATGETIQRNQVVMNTAFKTIGLFPVTIALHAEVKVDVIVNIARTTEEAEVQAKTGKALVAQTAQEEKAAQADARAQLMDAEAYEAEKAFEAEAAAEEAEAAAKAEEKSAKRAAKKAEAANDADDAEGESEEAAE